MRIEIFHVPGIRTQQDTEVVMQAVKRVTGTHTVRVNLAQRSVQVEYADHAAIGEVIRAIKRAGFDDVAVMV